MTTPNNTVASSTAASGPSEMATWVRNWVHYDNLASGLNKQTLNARKTRDEYESRIISALKRSNMAGAVIQVAGARLTLAEDTEACRLTLGKLEEVSKKYFETRGGADETDAFMRFFRKHRGTDTTEKLKKTVSTTR